MYSRQIVLLTILILSVFGCNKSEIDNTNYKSITIGEFIDDWTCCVNPGSSSNFDIARFRLWVPNPNDVSNLKAVLVLADYYNSDGLNLAYSEEWQNYAKINCIGILAIHIESMNSDYTEAGGGSGSALIMALEAIAKRNNIDKVASLPFLMRGYSGGGMFGYNFSGFKPQRVIAFANIRGLLITSITNSKDIPGLILIGELEDSQHLVGIKRIVETIRVQNGLWSFAIEPKIDHYGSLDKSDELIKVFLTSALKHRVSEGSNELLPIAQNNGWLGNNLSKIAYPYDTYPDNKNDASWLIDENFAKKWVDFQKEK